MSILLNGLIATLVLFLIIVLSLYIAKINVKKKETNTIEFMRGNVNMNNIKRVWVAIFCFMVLAAVYFTPYRATIPNIGNIYVGYGTLFYPAQFRSEHFAMFSSIEYGRIIIEIIAAGAACSIGYIISTIFKKTK